jgi:hypothetical protein
LGLGLGFFPLFVWIRARGGGDVGGVDPWADPAASSRDLFFPTLAPVFMLLDGEDFILQVHRVFTRIRSRASLVASSDCARGSVDYNAGARAQMDGMG